VTAGQDNPVRVRNSSVVKRLTGPAALGLMLALAATAGTAGIPAPSRPGPAPPFRASAPFIRDAAGRVRIFHGVNAVWKLKPYYPPSTVYPSPFATSIDQSYFDSRDADFLAGNGFNLVRLGVLWAGVEPQRGAFDAAYLDRVQELVRMLAARGVDVLLDFHQDLYNERFQGEGFPDWATINEVPATNCCGFPGNYFTPAVLRAFDNLWSRKGLRAEYAAAWAHVAARMAGEPNVIGYDLMNEPWAGTQWPTCAGPEGCVAFQNLFLQPFMEASAKAIRAAGGPGIAFWEPDVTNDFGAGDAVGLLHPFADASNGISCHAYCLAGGLVPGLSRGDDPACPRQETLVFRQQKMAMRRNGSALLLTEFGASDDLVDIGRVAAAADANMVGWTYWHYGSWSDPTGNPSEEGMFAGDLSRPGSLKQPKAGVLIRTYPQAIAGTPLSFSYDVSSRVFTMTYFADPLAATGPTEIFVPAGRPGFDGHYAVTLAGPAAVTSSPGASLLTLASTGRGRVTVTVTPG